MIELDDREIGTVLAGLRLRQQQLAPQRNGGQVEEIADGLGQWDALTTEEIERLCARLLHV